MRVPLRAVFAVARFVVELAADVIRGKDSAPAATPGLPFRDVERQAQVSRNAGHESPAPPRRR